MRTKKGSCRECSKSLSYCSCCMPSIEQYFCNQECLDSYRNKELPKILERFSLTEEKLKEIVSSLNDIHYGEWFTWSR